MDAATESSPPLPAYGAADHRATPAGGSPPAAEADGTRELEPVDVLPWLPCTLALDIPVMHFTVATLLTLKPGALVETAWHQSTDLPLRVNGLLMAWTEFEVVGERLAARITDLV
jgi:flagellar motor switch/type III secretory pathway protein FliN